MITVTILPILSILFSRVTVNVLFLFCALCFSCNCVYCYAVPVRCSVSGFCIVSKFCVKSVLMSVSEVTTRKGNESIVQKENCLVEEIKEVKLRSRRGKIY